MNFINLKKCIHFSNTMSQYNTNNYNVLCLYKGITEGGSSKCVLKKSKLITSVELQMHSEPNTPELWQNVTKSNMLCLTTMTGQSPCMRGSTKMNPIEEAVEDDVFEPAYPLATKAQRLP